MLKKWLVSLFILGAMASSALAQATPTPVVEPSGDVSTLDFAITFPPPVYVVAGQVAIRGTANKSNQTNYFIEFRPLTITPSAIEGQWFPATLPITRPVVNDVLGVWDTTIAPDGLYELRLVGNVRGLPVQYFRVAPVRVQNLIPAGQATPAGGFVAPTPATGALPTLPVQVVIPTLPNQPLQPNTQFATPTSALNFGGPSVTALSDANVRRGDGVNFERVGSLLAGESASVLGVSTTGTGWYYIELPNGRRGFIAPSLVRFNGSPSGLQQIQPPPPPATATPIPTATPVASADLIPGTYAVSPNPPTCNVPFNVEVNVNNIGTGRSSSPVVVRVQDRHIASNSITTATDFTIPTPIEPGQLYFLRVPLNVTTFIGEEHQVEIVIDPSGQSPELNKGNNFAFVRYTLQTGGC